jgi:hypothetical protein
LSLHPASFKASAKTGRLKKALSLRGRPHRYAVESLRLARERNIAYWTNRPQATANRATEAMEVAKAILGARKDAA